MEAMSLEMEHPRRGARAARKAPAKASSKATQPIRLEPVFDQVAAVALRDRLRALTAERAEIVIAAGDVERASTAGIQLLMAADAALSGRGGRLALRDPSPALSEALRDLGLGAELERWSA